MPVNWTTPDDLRAQVQKLWDSGRLLTMIVDEVIAAEGPRTSTLEVIVEAEGAGELRSPAGCGREPTSPPKFEFPLALRLRKPGPRDLGTRFDEVRDWIKGLEAGSRGSVGAGYDIEWDETSNRLLGRNATPSRIVVPTRADALEMIGATAAAEQFETLTGETLRRFPALSEWLRRNPLAVLAEADAWHRILSVVAWFRAHPRSGLYLRQIDVPGVDTKFIEVRKALLGQLFDAILPADFIDPAITGTAGFEQRYERWSRLFGQDLRFDKWIVCRG